MDELPSSEFRKRYAALTAPTVVTVNGHAIGTWVPAGANLPEAPSARAPEPIRASNDLAVRAILNRTLTGKRS